MDLSSDSIIQLCQKQLGKCHRDLNLSFHSNLILFLMITFMCFTLKPGLHSVRRSTQTELRKRIYAVMAFYTPCVDLGACTQTYTQQRFAYHFREMDLFDMPRKSLHIRRGCGLLANGNPASMRKRRRIVGVFILCICAITTV